jgi:pyridoxamine 5'-phosphate oxidase
VEVVWTWRGLAGIHGNIEYASMTTDFNEPQSLDEILASAWTLLRRGAADRRHGFHHPVIATIGLDGTPKSRVVILRNAEPEAKTLRFHTDVRSQKWHELSRNPAISMTLYDPGGRVQIRIDGKATLHSGDDLASLAWSNAQPMSRVIYGINPGPGVEIADGDRFTLPDQQAGIGFENFGVVVLHVAELEWLFLKQARNRRARFDFENHKALWLVP